MPSGVRGSSSSFVLSEPFLEGALAVLQAAHAVTRGPQAPVLAQNNIHLGSQLLLYFGGVQGAFEHRRTPAAGVQHHPRGVCELIAGDLRVFPVHTRTPERLDEGPDVFVSLPEALDGDTIWHREIRRLRKQVEEDSGVVRGRSSLFVRVAELVAQLAHHPCLVAKGVHVEGGDKVFVSVCLEAPGHRRPCGETEVAYRQVLRVVIVAPVGVEQSYGPVPEAVVGTTGDRVPRRGARTYEERYA